MKTKIERRKPEGPLDYVSLAVTTVGVGYLPLAPGTWGSMVGVLIYLGVARIVESVRISPTFYGNLTDVSIAWIHAIVLVLFVVLCLLGVWAAGRATELLGNLDPSEAVIDEVMGQLTVFFFIPFGLGWPFVLAGFLLFRLFDIWKPYPINSLENLPGGLGVCADDMLAGIYGGVCLAVIYAVSLSV
jgi:phosphatidylglycerophosphatase A